MEQLGIVAECGCNYFDGDCGADDYDDDAHDTRGMQIRRNPPTFTMGSESQQINHRPRIRRGLASALSTGGGRSWRAFNQGALSASYDI